MKRINLTHQTTQADLIKFAYQSPGLVKQSLRLGKDNNGGYYLYTKPGQLKQMARAISGRSTKSLAKGEHALRSAIRVVNELVSAAPGSLAKDIRKPLPPPAVPVHGKSPSLAPLSRNYCVQQVRVLAQHVWDKSMNQTGIFRLSVTQNKMNSSLNEIHQGKPITLDAADNDPYLAPALIKYLAREFPGGVFGDQASKFDAAIRNLGQDKSEKNWKAVSDLIQALPPENRAFFEECCALLVAAGKNAQENKMDFCNLAVCFAPNLFPPSQTMEALAISKEQSLGFGIYLELLATEK